MITDLLAFVLVLVIAAMLLALLESLYSVGHPVEESTGTARRRPRSSPARKPWRR